MSFMNFKKINDNIFLGKYKKVYIYNIDVYNIIEYLNNNYENI